VTLLALIALASFSLCLWASANAPDAAFFLLPMRIWELAIGAFIAFYCFRNEAPHVRGLAGELLSLAGLLLILVSFLSYSSAIPFPSFYALAPTLGAALLILFASPDNRVGRFLASGLMVGIGLVSYSAYLWHQPVFAFLRHIYEELSLGMMLLGTGFVFVLSFLSWRFVERPFRNRTRMPRGRFFKTVAGLGMAILLLGGLGTQLFSAKAKTGAEAALAQALVSRAAVYASNMDERLFAKNRILLETRQPDRAIAFTHGLRGRGVKRGSRGVGLRFFAGSVGCAWDTGCPDATRPGRTCARQRSCGVRGLCAPGSHPRGR
jgi:peptidoglycan/LPS O-acetylase OafA/YrhL